MNKEIRSWFSINKPEHLIFAYKYDGLQDENNYRFGAHYYVHRTRCDDFCITWVHPCKQLYLYIRIQRENKNLEIIYADRAGNIGDNYERLREPSLVLSLGISAYLLNCGERRFRDWVSVLWHRVGWLNLITRFANLIYIYLYVR